MYKILFFILLLFFNNIANASPTEGCEPEKIKEKLIELGLDPEIKKNKELVAAFSVKYGPAVAQYLTDTHPRLLFDSENEFDERTVSWAIDAIWESDNPATRYTPILGDVNNESILSDYIFHIYNQLRKYSQKITPVFMSNADLKVFNKVALALLYKRLLSEYPNMAPENLDKALALFDQYYLKSSRVLVGFDSVKDHTPVVVIFGHGDAGKEAIQIGNVSILVSELVQKLKGLNLPSNATIKINACFSGCVDEKLNYSTEEIKSLFKHDMLTTIGSSVHGSLLEKFSVELFRELPSFTGVVQAYMGVVFSRPCKNVLKKDGSLMPIGNAVEITGNDGSILLKKEQVRVSMSRSNMR